MIKNGPTLVAPLALILTAVTASASSSHPSLLLRHVNVVPMTEERVIEDVSLLARDGRIAAIGVLDTLKVPEDALVIEGNGAYLLPGLIEMHVHLRKAIDLDLFLGHGVTSVRNMDGTPQVLRWREAVAAGEISGPTITSGSPFLHRYAKDAPARFVGSVDDARRLVRQYADEGYDYIKIAELDDEPFFALMDEARSRSIPVVGHIPNYDLDLERIFAERMRSIEHVEELFRVYFDYEPDASKIPAFVESVRRSHVPISTLVATEVIKNGLFAERAAYLTPERLQWIERYNGAAGVENIRRTLQSIESGGWERPSIDIDFLLRLVVALHEGGVLIVPGTDSGGSFLIPGHGLHEELALLNRAGLSPYETLRTATVNAAKVLGVLDDRGTVSVGKQADLVLVDGNPLESIAVARAPIGLLLRGVWLGPEKLESLRGRTFTDER